MATALTPHTDYHWNAEAIRGLRKFLRLSQSAFSKQLGIRQQTVSEWETGVYEPRGASSTLLNVVASGAGFGLVAESESEPRPTPEARPEPPMPAPRFTEQTAEPMPDARIAPRYEGPFPPHAPSTERGLRARGDGAAFRASSAIYSNSPPTGPIARREVPM
ncbi:MAG: helix-turn-helix domain-containing protein [Chloroflexi bacterium]|nr:helix-turn-helix domain-containing protein [Chloroflexota bacterium]